MAGRDWLIKRATAGQTALQGRCELEAGHCGCTAQRCEG